MTIHFPDVSHWNKGYVVPDGTSVVIARCSLSSTYRDDTYATFKARAEKIGAVFVAYHWLNRGNEAAQARLAYSMAGETPLMIDAEDMSGNTGYNGPNTIGNILTFAAMYRSLGGTVSLVYLPKWYWRDRMGSPSLTLLASAQLNLVSSNYTTYSDSGPGWGSYGGVSPVQWQYRGSPLDLNAYRGTKEEYARMVGAKVLTTHGKVSNMFMVRRGNFGDTASVDLYQDDGTFITHIDNEPDRDFFKAAGVPFIDGISERYYTPLTTPRSPEVSLPEMPTAAQIAAEIIRQIRES